MPINSIPTAEPAPSPLMRFAELRLAAHALLQAAARVEGLGPMQRAQAEAGAALSGLDLHRIHGHATAADARSLRQDLDVLARKIDPLIAAIGDVAASEFHGVGRGQFKDVLADAIHDRAGDELDRIASKAEEDAAEVAYDYANPGTFRAGLHEEV